MKDHDIATIGQVGSRDAADLPQRDLEARVTELERQVVTLAAAVDAASRLQIGAPFTFTSDIRIAGGRAVRRILEKGRLIRGYA